MPIDPQLPTNRQDRSLSRLLSRLSPEAPSGRGSELGWPGDQAHRTVGAAVPAPPSYVVQVVCGHQVRPFRLRAMQNGAGWLVVDAFVPRPAAAKPGGRVADGVESESSLTGPVETSPSYPGCPHCGARSLFGCACGRLSCWDQAPVVRCPSCGRTSVVNTPLTRMEGQAERSGTIPAGSSRPLQLPSGERRGLVDEFRKRLGRS